MTIHIRANLQFGLQNATFSSCLSTGENVILFSARISQAIFSLNYLHHSAVFIDIIFVHSELIFSMYNVQLKKNR